MSKLTNLQSQLSIVGNTLAPVHANEAQRSAYRYGNTQGRVWANSTRWHKLRKHVLHRDNYTCTEQGCGVLLVHKTHLLVAHHNKAHKGNAVLFWDEKNIRTVCKQCHDSIIQSREREEQMKGR